MNFKTKVFTIPMDDVHGTTTLALAGDNDEMRQVLVVNNVYFALPDQCVVEFNMHDMQVELHMSQTTHVVDHVGKGN